MKYVILLDKYDYFGGASTTEYKSYTDLLEFWKEFKELKRTDYNYGDSYQSTHYFTVHEDPVEIPPQRPHARSYEEWEKISLARKQAEEKLAPFDFDDEPIII